jgi:hypothetical protein
MPKILANAHESFTTTAQSRVQRLHPRGCSPRLRRHPMGTMHLVSLRRTSSERSSGSLSEGLCLNSNPAPPSASTMSLLALLQACLLAANSIAILNEERFLDPSTSSSPPLLLLEQLVSTYTLGHPQTGGATQHCSITPRFIALSRARSSAPFTPSAIFAVRHLIVTGTLQLFPCFLSLSQLVHSQCLSLQSTSSSPLSPSSPSSQRNTRKYGAHVHQLTQ